MRGLKKYLFLIDENSQSVPIPCAACSIATLTVVVSVCNMDKNVRASIIEDNL